MGSSGNCEEQQTSSDTRSFDHPRNPPANVDEAGTSTQPVWRCNVRKMLFLWNEMFTARKTHDRELIFKKSVAVTHRAPPRIQASSAFSELPPRRPSGARRAGRGL